MTRLAPAALIFALLASACTRGEAAQPGPATAKGSALPQLVFFMNPNGRPCQLQDQVLRELEPELAGKVEVVRLKTTVDADLPRFERYGVRSLPLLVVTDAGGKELRRATPGVQQAESVRKLVSP